MDPPSETTPSAGTGGVDLEALWNRNYHLLRDCRALERRVGEFGIRYPVIDLLVTLGHVNRDRALETVGEDHIFPTDLPYQQPEEKVLTRACALQRLTTGQIVAAQQILRSVAKLGAPASLSYVLVELNYVRWKDLVEIDRELRQGAAVVPGIEDRETESGPLAAVRRDGKPGAPANLEDCETTYVKAMGRSGKSRGSSSRVFRMPSPAEPQSHEEAMEADRRLRQRLREIPEADLIGLLRETRMVNPHDLETSVELRVERLRETGKPVSLGEILLDRGFLAVGSAEILLSTWERTQGGDPRRQARGA